jgi:hypothetical protein
MFKEGDLVECVDDSFHAADYEHRYYGLKAGRCYAVRKFVEYPNGKGLVRLYGVEFGWAHDRFVLFDDLHGDNT